MKAADALVTIAVVPRERFSETQASLESIYANTRLPFELIYVDGKSPTPIRRYLAAQARERGFRLIRSDRYLTPNQARNLALREITTEYVVFVDNDVLVAPGWLEALLECAEETGASIVGPLYFAGAPGTRSIHMAGGLARVEDRDGVRVLNEHHHFAWREAEAAAGRLRREPTELVEFHCMLVRMEVFEQFGLLDEQLRSVLEHVDLCLTVLASGGSVYFEPKSEITHVMPPPFAFSDYPYFMLRWSDAWNTSSINHFQHKWGLQSDDRTLCTLREWLRRHRQLYFQPAWNVLYPVVGWRRSHAIERGLTDYMARLVG